MRAKLYELVSHTWGQLIDKEKTKFKELFDCIKRGDEIGAVSIDDQLKEGISSHFSGLREVFRDVADAYPDERFYSSTHGIKNRLDHQAIAVGLVEDVDHIKNFHVLLGLDSDAELSFSEPLLLQIALQCVDKTIREFDLSTYAIGLLSELLPVKEFGHMLSQEAIHDQFSEPEWLRKSLLSQFPDEPVNRSELHQSLVNVLERGLLDKLYSTESYVTASKLPIQSLSKECMSRESLLSDTLMSETLTDDDIDKLSVNINVHNALMGMPMGAPEFFVNNKLCLNSCGNLMRNT